MFKALTWAKTAATMLTLSQLCVAIPSASAAAPCDRQATIAHAVAHAENEHHTIDRLRSILVHNPESIEIAELPDLIKLAEMEISRDINSDITDTAIVTITKIIDKNISDPRAAEFGLKFISERKWVRAGLNNVETQIAFESQVIAISKAQPTHAVVVREQNLLALTKELTEELRSSGDEFDIIDAIKSIINNNPALRERKNPIRQAAVAAIQKEFPSEKLISKMAWF